MPPCLADIIIGIIAAPLRSMSSLARLSHHLISCRVIYLGMSSSNAIGASGRLDKLAIDTALS